VTELSETCWREGRGDWFVSAGMEQAQGAQHGRDTDGKSWEALGIRFWAKDTHTKD